MIRLDQDGDYWTATIDRPDKANSLTGPMLVDLTELAREAGREAQVLILTGVGNVFSAGADLNAVRDGLAIDPIWEELSQAIATLPCLTIAALNGTLAGGAFGMALACDLRISVPEASFFYPVMKLGYLPQPSDPQRLTALVGPARAKLILMCGAKISAAEALAWGLVDRIVPRSEFTSTISELSEAVLGADAEHVATIKAMIC